MITGLKTTSKNNFQLDAGALFKNYDISTDTPTSAASKIIGATVGGATLSLTPEVRQIAVDGAKGPTVGLEIYEAWTAILTASVKEVTADSLTIALGSVTSSTTAVTGYTQIIPNQDIADSDYIDNITWIGKIIGKTKPIAIVMKNVLSLNGLSFQVQDKNEGVIPLVLTAHYEISDLDTAPVAIYVPTT